MGRLCTSETPEGTNIGLRKNLALLASISHETPEEDLIPILVKNGLELEKTATVATKKKK
jgi:DNA-directed RNA polymerase subunit B